MSDCTLARPVNVMWRSSYLVDKFTCWSVVESPWNESGGVEEMLNKGLVAAMAVDPGIDNGLALLPFSDDHPILLADLSPTGLTEVLLRTPVTAAMHLIVERPLHGAVRVFDPMPWQMYGFLYHWHSAMSRAPWTFVHQSPDALDAGYNLAHVTTRNVPQHEKDALAHLAVALHKHEEIREMI